MSLYCSCRTLAERPSGTPHHYLCPAIPSQIADPELVLALIEAHFQSSPSACPQTLCPVPLRIWMVSHPLW